MQVEGTSDPRFKPVREAFCENFTNRGELGAAVVVTVDGTTVVDLWGGIAERGHGRPWTPETMVVVFSCTKGATALCAHMLAARGVLDLDAPVARYWPEFAAADKGTISVRMLLNHQAGMAAIDQPLPSSAVYDWGAMTAALAAQAPHWEPGSAHGYHAATFGWLVGEVVRRVSGRSLGAFFREEVTARLNLDFYIGLPEVLEPRVAPIRMPPLTGETTPIMRMMADRSSLTSKAFLNPPGLLTSRQINGRALHAAEVPAANGIATARGLAGVYTPLACGGRSGAVELLDGDTLEAMATVESEGDDLVLLIATRFASGFMKSMDNGARDSAVLGPNPAAFGHGGAGGSIGMADPTARVAIGYVMNQMGVGILLNDRGQALIDAVYASLG